MSANNTPVHSLLAWFPFVILLALLVCVCYSTNSRSTYFDLSQRRPPTAVAVPMSVLTNGKVNSRFDSIDPRTLYVNLINSFRKCNLTLYCVPKTRNVDKVELENVPIKIIYYYK